jgi:hypothetical protein
MRACRFSVRVPAVSRLIPDRGQRSARAVGWAGDSWWAAPYWDIDTGFASLLMMLTAVDAGLGACFFGIPVERIDAYRAAFRAISAGYSDEPPRDLSSRRRPEAETIHRGRWTQSAT